MSTKRIITTGLLSILLFLLAACRNQEALPTLVSPAATPTTTAGSTTSADNQVTAPEPTPDPPTPTPLPPLAALVNDQPIFLETYEKELARYEQAQFELGVFADNNDYRQLVLDALIEQALIEQAANENGITISPELVDQKLIEMRDLAGGAQNLDAWLQANQYTLEEFRHALASEMLTERLVDFVTRAVPHAVEQVRARYLQVDDGSLAAALHQQIEAGADFSLLAQTHSLDRETGQNGGDLGYFARGTLLVLEVEQAAFALEVGATSEVIAVTNSTGQTTYYLVQLIERDPERPLDANARYNLLRQTFETWLAEVWTTAEVVRFVDDN